MGSLFCSEPHTHTDTRAQTALGGPGFRHFCCPFISFFFLALLNLNFASRALRSAASERADNRVPRLVRCNTEPKPTEPTFSPSPDALRLAVRSDVDILTVTCAPFTICPIPLRERYAQKRFTWNVQNPIRVLRHTLMWCVHIIIMISVFFIYLFQRICVRTNSVFIV